MKLYGKLHYQQEMCILSAGYGWMILSSAVFEENLRYCHSQLVRVVRASENFNMGHNFCNIEDSNLIFGMHVYLMKLHILSGKSSRSMSSFKVKGQNTKSREVISFKKGDNF